MLIIYFIEIDVNNCIINVCNCISTVSPMFFFDPSFHLFNCSFDRGILEKRIKSLLDNCKVSFSNFLQLSNIREYRDNRFALSTRIQTASPFNGKVA